MRRSYLRTPVRGGGRRGPGGSGRVAPGPLPAPHRAPQLGPQFPQLFRSGATPLEQHQVSTDISRLNLSAPRASCRLMRHRRGSAQSQTPPVPASVPGSVCACSSKVEFNLAAIPPGLASFLLCVRSSLRCGPYSAKTPQSLPGVQDTAVPAVGAACVRQCRA